MPSGLQFDPFFPSLPIVRIILIDISQVESNPHANITTPCAFTRAHRQHGIPPIPPIPPSEGPLLSPFSTPSEPLLNHTHQTADSPRPSSHQPPVVEKKEHQSPIGTQVKPPAQPDRYGRLGILVTKAQGLGNTSPSIASPHRTAPHRAAPALNRLGLSKTARIKVISVINLELSGSFPLALVALAALRIRKLPCLLRESTVKSLCLTRLPGQDVTSP